MRRSGTAAQEYYDDDDDDDDDGDESTWMVGLLVVTMAVPKVAAWVVVMVV